MELSSVRNEEVERNGFHESSPHQDDPYKLNAEVLAPKKRTWAEFLESTSFHGVRYLAPKPDGKPTSGNSFRR